MTQHLLPEDTLEDKRAMRHLAIVIGIFAIATLVMALTVGMLMG